MTARPTHPLLRAAPRKLVVALLLARRLEDAGGLAMQ